MLQEWSTMIDGDSANNVMSIRVDPDAKIYVTGYTKSSTIGVEPSYSSYPGRYGNYDGFIIKCNSTDGIIQNDGANAWTRRFGGTQNDFIYSIALENNVAIYFSGATGSNAINLVEYQAGATNNLGGSDGFLSKYESGGRFVWSRRFGGTSNDVITSITNYSHFLFVVGYTTSDLLTGEMGVNFRGGEDGFISQYDDRGNQLWVARLGGSGNDRIYGNVCDISGNLYVCGTTTSPAIGNESESQQNNLGQIDGFVAKYNSLGDVLWLHRIAGSVKTITIDTYDSIYVGGTAGTNQLLIAKYSSNGSLQWISYYTGSSDGTISITSIACGFDNSIFICGTTTSAVLQGESGSNNIIGYADSYVAKFTTAGEFQWTQRVGYVQSTTTINTITLTANNAIFVGGQIDTNRAGSSELSNLNGFFSRYTDTKYGYVIHTSTSKIEYCLKPFSRKSRVGAMSMCSNVLYTNLVTGGNDPKLTKSMQYSSYISTRKPMKYIYSAPAEPEPTSGIITTVAGTGVFGTSGDGGLATLATFQNPYCCNVDNSGNIYVADDSNRVRKIDVDTGIISTVIGNGLQSANSQEVGDGSIATDATMNTPLDVVIDSSNNLYVCDSYNRRIRKVDATTQIIETIAGTGYSTNQNMSNLGDNGNAIDATFRMPHGIYVDSQYNIYVTDTVNMRIRKIDVGTGIITTIIGTNTPTPNLGDGGLAINANIRAAKALCMDSLGNIYVADTGNRRIRKIDATTGIITTICGTGNSGFNGDDILASAANLGAPSDIITDSANNIYIADTAHQRVRKISYSTNIITTVAGNGTTGYSGDTGYATSATLNNPGGISIDHLGNLYIADTSNYVIRKVSA